VVGLAVPAGVGARNERYCSPVPLTELVLLTLPRKLLCDYGRRKAHGVRLLEGMAAL
jgi:hypothetical protein